MKSAIQQKDLIMDDKECNNFVIRENINHVVYCKELRNNKPHSKEGIEEEKDKECNYKYRYELTRSYRSGSKLLCFIMFNPSTSNSEESDNTTKRCLSIAKNWGYDGIALYNLYAIRSKDKKAVERRIKTNKKHAIAEIVGKENKEVLDHAIKCKQYDKIVCAWGNHPHSEDFDTRALNILKRIGIGRLRILGISKKKMPNHPLGVSTEITEKRSESLAIQYIERITEK